MYDHGMHLPEGTPRLVYPAVWMRILVLHIIVNGAVDLGSAVRDRWVQCRRHSRFNLCRQRLRHIGVNRRRTSYGIDLFITSRGEIVCMWQSLV